jgi:hypothetical protein
MNPTLLGATVLVTVAAAVRGTWSPCGLSMVSAINPFSERARGNRYWVTTLWFITGSILGGAALGSGAGLLTWVLRPLAEHPAVTLSMATSACLIAVAADLEVSGFHLPLHPRQLNEVWLARYRRWIYGAGFGVQVGTGFATYIMTAATYLMVVLAALGGSPLAALGVGLLFGLVRGLAVLWSSRARTPTTLRLLHRGLSRAEPWSRRVVIGVQVSAALALGFAALGPFGALIAAIVVLMLVAIPLRSRGPTKSDIGHAIGHSRTVHPGSVR